MQERSPHRASKEGTSPPPTKRLGGYLVEAGLLTPAQVDVVLNDQKMSGMRFGEILAARGWVKQQTIEYLMQKVILPEQGAVQPRTEALAEQDMVHNKQIEGPAMTSSHNFNERRDSARLDVPNSTPRPSVSASDDDVNWVG